MEVHYHYSDLLIYYFQHFLHADVTKTPYGITIIEYVYADDKMAIFILSADNELINWHFE